MILVLRAFLVLYGLIAIGTGFHAMTGPYVSTADPMVDNSHRFIAAIWASLALGFFYCAWFPSEIVLFRFLMIALFIGGIVRAVALINYPATPFLIFLIAIELIPTVLLLWMHNKLINAGLL